MKSIKYTALVLLPLVAVCYGAYYAFNSHDDAFSREGLIKADAADLRRTVVTPHLEEAIAGGRNVLWCGSFQLAWNEACVLLGEDLHFEPEAAMTAVLNKKQFTEQDIDEESYAAVAGFVKDDVFTKIQQELDDKFKGKAAPRYIPPQELTPRPQDIVAYAYMFKNLEFAVPFERIEEPLTFGKDKTSCFGVEEEFKEEHAEMLEQFEILDYRDENDFIIEFKTKSEKDRVILAKIEPQSTLAATIEAVEKRAAAAPPLQPQFGDVLKVPKLNFDVTRRYDELENKRLVVNNPKIAPDLFVASAVQNVRFQLDEKGVRLKSESHISMKCAAPPHPPAKHIMIFDKPFLLMLQRNDAQTPCFALWVDNAELLMKML